MTILELTFQLSQSREAARTLLDTAHAEARNLTLAEQIKFDSLVARCHETEQQIEARAALRTA
jgi:hypothetical protein